MTLIGCTLKHISNGLGIVEDIQQDRIWVRFCNSYKGEIVSKFIIPHAFEKKFLIPVDDETAIIIKALIDELKCSICGSTDSPSEIIDEIRVCKNCKNTITQKCSFCNDYHIKEQFVLIEISRETEYYKIREKVPMCMKCSQEQSFICEECGKKLYIDFKSKIALGNKVLCQSCFDELIVCCSCCGNYFYIDDCKILYDTDYGKKIYLCRDCVSSNTFTCGACDRLRVKESLVKSKFIPNELKICTNCAKECEICHSKIYGHENMDSFGKYCCPDCRNNYMRVCEYCNEEFIAANSDNQMCPDCIEMTSYVERLKEIDYSALNFRKLYYFELENIDRCKLFTHLYENVAHKNIMSTILDEQELFEYIILDRYSYKLLIAYLPKSVVGRVRHSENVTMTEFRTRRGASRVGNAAREWTQVDLGSIRTQQGLFQIINYPILLRVQTNYDKNYGKQWNGPDDYIEIGNYGDTTDFHIIGIQFN